jgi:hypothetical protein
MPTSFDQVDDFIQGTEDSQTAVGKSLLIGQRKEEGPEELYLWGRPWLAYAPPVRSLTDRRAQTLVTIGVEAPTTARRLSPHRSMFT